MKHKIGVIAEDDSDVQVANELIKKISPRKEFVIRRFVGHGCGKLRSKCLSWAIQLKNQGCSMLIVFHDLDDRTLTDLEAEIKSLLRPCPIERHLIIIPIREIEAWLLSDHLAIKKALKLRRTFPRIANPQSIVNPKRMLGDLIFSKSDKRKRYVVEDNQKIASHIQIVNIRRCSSFLPLEHFIKTHLI